MDPFYCYKEPVQPTNWDSTQLESESAVSRTAAAEEGVTSSLTCTHAV